MNETTRMLRLLSRLKKEMNGAVTEAMQQRGVNYPLNYGVSVPTIQSITKEYAPNHALALLLFQQQVRELKLAAAFVDDPQQVTLEQMRAWARDFTHAEVVEQVVYTLFRHTPMADVMAMEWLEADDSWLCYAGLLMAASLVYGNRSDEFMQRIFEQVDRLAIAPKKLTMPVSRGVVSVLIRLAKISPEIRIVIQEHLSDYALELTDELTWQLDYLG